MPSKLAVNRLHAACFILPVIVSALSPPALAEESAASEIAALRQELKALAEKNQKQIDTLQRQVRDLSTELARRRGAPRPGQAVAAVAAPAAAPGANPPARKPATGGAAEALPEEPKAMELPPVATAPMLPPQMQNLPGRSVTAPYTGAGPGAPGPYLVTPASAVSSGGNRVALSLSGQINRALLYGDDGHDSKLRQVDNNNSSSRFRIVGEAKPFDEVVAGMNLEVEVRPNSSANQTLTQNLPQPASAVTPTIRQAEVFAGHPEYGEVRLGFGSTASYLTAEIDISGTAVASYEIVSDYNGGFAFRQKDAARVPGGPGAAFVLSPANAYGPAVASVFNSFDGLNRDDRIRYDTPLFGGFQFSTSLLDGGAFDVAGRYARQFDDFQIAGGVGLGFATARGRAQPTAYGYAGVPAGVQGASLAGTNSAPNAPVTADSSFNRSTQFDGSVSALMTQGPLSGFNLTFAGGIRDPHYHDPLGQRLSPNLFFVKLGYQHRFVPWGLTAFSVDYAENDELIFHNDKARAYGIAAVQNIDPFGMEVFLAGRYETLDRTFASYHPILAILGGSRVRF